MKLHEAIAVTYAAMGHEVSDAALKVMVADLSAYPLEGVLVALSRCRKELKRLSLADIIDRIPGGHPGPEEAWAQVSVALGNEDVTLVWTEPMREAFFVADKLSNDPIAARMAFKETYTRLVAIAREKAQPPVYCATLGQDASSRVAVLEQAVQDGRLSPKYVSRLLPYRDLPEWEALAGVKLLQNRDAA